jgi:hypothetical protein
MRTDTIPRQFDVEEVAEILRRTPKAIRQLHARDQERIRNGEQPEGPRFTKRAGRLLCDEVELARWLAGTPDDAV